MKKWLNKNIHFIAGAVLGTIAGFFYWQQIGCNSGTCAITSNPVNSSIYGGVMGGLVAGMVKKEGKNESLPEDKIQA